MLKLKTILYKKKTNIKTKYKNLIHTVLIDLFAVENIFLSL